MPQRLEPPREPLGLQISKSPTNRRPAPPEALRGAAFIEPDHVATTTRQAVEILDEKLPVFRWSAD